MVSAAPLISAACGLFVLLLLGARPVDSCIATAGSSGCLCDSTATTCGSGGGVWFSCRQQGTAALQSIGLAFTFSRTQAVDLGYRWYIANGNYPGQTSGFSSGTIPYLPYSTNSVNGAGSQASPQWLTSGINPLTLNNPVTSGGWACTADNLLLRSLNGGIGPTQPKCQFGADPPAQVQVGSSCPPVKLFDGFSQPSATGWVLAAAAVRTVGGDSFEYPDASTRAGPFGANIGTVPTSNGLDDGELRQLVSITGTNVNVQCYISLFDPCSTCPDPQTITTPGCCPSGQQLVGTHCCPTGSIVTDTSSNPPQQVCCPTSGGPWVVCTGATTGCTQAASPNTEYCCPAARWIAASQTCCPSGETAVPPFGGGAVICCPSAQIINGQCCPTSTSTIVDGTCCPNSRLIDGHCCLTCNTPSVQCSSVTPTPTSATYTWISGTFCCADAFINAGTCCPNCVTSPTTIPSGNDLRASGDCGRGTANCCPAAQVVAHRASGANYCCPAGTTYTSDFRVVDRSESSNSRTCCPGPRIKCDGSSVPYICCSDATDYCVSSGAPCCPAGETVVVTPGPSPVLGCCFGDNDEFDCGGSPTTVMTNCQYLGQGNCCPNTRVTTNPSNPSERECCPASGGPFVWTPACGPCSDDVSGVVRCCPTARVARDGSNNPVACCVQAWTAANYVQPPPRSLSNPTQSSGDYCCPVARQTTGNSATNTAGLTFCCPSSNGPYAIIEAAGNAVQCCPVSRVPNAPGTSNPDYAAGVCCPSNLPSGASWYLIDGECCDSRNAVNNAGTWICCPGAGQVIIDGECCAPGDAITNGGTPIYCCPNGNNGVLCTNYPPSGSCYVYDNAPGYNNILNPNESPYENCCPASRISWSGSGTPSATTNYYCCPGSSEFRFATNNECCPPNRVTTNWDGVARPTTPARAPGTAWCCPNSVSSTGVYTQTTDNDCCLAINVNLRPGTNPPASVTTADARCCPSAGRYLVNARASSLTNDYLYCCPQNQLLAYSGNYYCCENQVNGGEIWFTNTVGTTYTGCCVETRIITNPNAATEKVCCPPSANPWAWADTKSSSSSWPSGMAHCCDARFALETTVAALADIYCCPTNTPNAGPQGIPGAPGYSGPTQTPWQVFRQVPNSAVTGNGWNSVPYQCCPPANKQVNSVTDGSGSQVSICCPGSNLTYIIGDSSHRPACCPYDTIRWDGAVGDLTKASCCPPDRNITAISEATNLTMCCPPAQYNNDGICCVINPIPTTPRSTVNEPCCEDAHRIALAPVFPDYAGEYLCCPPISGRPAPFIDPNPNNNPPECCYGYSTSVPPTACCPDSTDFATADDPCCPTVARADNTCCPEDQWIPGPGGAPQSGSCCADNEVFVNNGTVIRCCAEQYADVTGTVCCEPASGQVLDDQGNCCPLDIISFDPTTGLSSCCGPDERDDFGVCCLSTQVIHTGAVVNGVANATMRICCANDTLDCAGICYWEDPNSGNSVLVPFNTRDVNGVCCPNLASERDCAGLCPDPDTGLPINVYNATWQECCPNSERDCAGRCGGRDRNCCENQPFSTECDACIAKTGCGWCSSPFSSTGECLSGNHFGPYTDPSGLSPCDVGNRWVVNPPSEVISRSGTFADGWNMQYKNYTVTLAPNMPLKVNFTVRVPANVPLDLYILQDGTASFGTQVNGQPSSLQNFQSVLPNLLQVIQTNVTADLTVGFGLFADKAVEPFGYWAGSSMDYLWRNLAALTNTPGFTPVINAVNALTNNMLNVGADIPEGTLEALLALGVRATEVNWRQPTATFSSNHVVLVVTDAPPHRASLNQPRDTNGPFDLSWWLDPAAPANSATLGLGNDVRTSPAWVPNDGLATFTPNLCNRPHELTVTPTIERQGQCMDYPSFAQTITALQSQAITPVFIVADTVGFNPNGGFYDVDAARDSWNEFLNDYADAEGVPHGQLGLVTPLTGIGSATGAEDLQNAILNALYQITQTIALRITGGSEWVVGVEPSNYTSAIPGQDYTFTVELIWNGTWPGIDGPHPVDVLSLFPNTNFPIEPGHIDIYLARELFCGYCGDGIVQPDIGEGCEPGITDGQFGVDLPCCNSECEIERNLCNGLARCIPTICDATGHCQNEEVTCTEIIDPLQQLCSSNSCINGLCVVSCFGANESNPCCDDGDNCTRDTCVAGVCRHDFELPCDCGGNPAYNSCFACIAVSNTSCGWDLSTGSCVNINITDLLLNPENYGLDGDNVSVVVYEQDVADKRCVAERSPGSKVGIIVGVIAGVAALAALIALAAVFGGRIQQIAQRIFGSTGASGGAANKVLNNPAYEVAIQHNNAAYA